MATRPKNRYWRLCRIYFRRFRIAVWLVILGLLGCFIYLNQIGLPHFVKKPLLQKLRTRGIDLQFTRLRLTLDRGVVAENVRFGNADDPLSPYLTSAQVQVLLNARALLKLQLQVDSLVLRHGQLLWPIALTNGAARLISIDNIQTDLRLLPNDQWALDNFTASFAGGHIQLTGNLTNASAVRQWTFFQPGKPGASRGSLNERLRRLADNLERIQFSAPPELNLDLKGDARDPQSFLVRLSLIAPGSQTPWGNFTKGTFLARLHPAASNGVLHAEMHLEAARAQTAWATTTNLHLTIHLLSQDSETTLVNGDLALTADAVHTDWATLTNAQFSAQWVHSITNPIPLSGDGHLQGEGTQTKWGTAGKLELVAHMTDPNAPARSNAPLRLNEPLPALSVWWTNLEPHLLDWECRLQDVQSPKLQLDELAFSGNWRAPQLTLTILQARFDQGEMAGKCSLDVVTRALSAKLASTVDPHKLSPLLTEGGRRWLKQFSWNQPPEVAADIALVLPAWTNQQPDWRREVQPTIRIDGQFRLEGGGAFREVPVSSAQSHFAYSNMCWKLPNLTLTRPEGRLDALHQADDRTKDYYWKLRSTIDPKIVSPLLEPEQRRGLDFFSFSQPPSIDAEVWGRWRNQDRIGFRARVLATNFTFRGQSADSFQTALQYTNLFLHLTNAYAWIGTQLLSAASLAVDFEQQKIYLTNGFSTADPRVVTRAISPEVDAVIEPYRFSKPPTAHVYGTIPFKDENDADLHFDVDGGPFHWWHFNIPYVAGHAHWKGMRLSLTGLRGAFYGGAAAGSARFLFQTNDEASFQFNLSTTNSQLKWLLADFSTHTNNIEGFLSGSVIVNSANSGDWQSWQGGGSFELKDGLIWDIPIFGAISPMLNSIAPGLGNSRASASTGSFAISNSIIHSDDLQIRTSGTRLQYRGTVDFQGRVDARVEAELLRDMWMVGPVISTFFGPVSKLFEYKVSGTLAQPKTDPVFFVPRIVLMPFHPIRTLKELFPQGSPDRSTNAPGRLE